MSALNTIMPVLLMLVLGYVSKKKNLITNEENQGAKALIFNILFPVLIVYLLSSAIIEASQVLIVGYVLCSFVLIMVAGKYIIGLIDPEHAHFAYLLLTAVEGGNIALPLYLSIVKNAGDIVVIDIAGLLFSFVVLPLYVGMKSSGEVSLKEQLKAMSRNSFVIAVILGLFLNISGIYQMAVVSDVGELIVSLFEIVKAPIVPVILFCIGYDIDINLEMLKPLGKLMCVKTIFHALLISGFFVFFKSYTLRKEFIIAILIYFSCPTGLGTIPAVSKLYKSEEDSFFTSGFISMYMIVTLIVYIGVVLFIA